MTSWSYRVMRKTSDGLATDGIYEVFEVDGKITSWTDDPVAPTHEAGEPGSLKGELLHQINACDLPVLNHATGKPISEA